MIYSIDPEGGGLLCAGEWPRDAREALRETRKKYQFLVEYLTDAAAIEDRHMLKRDLYTRLRDVLIEARRARNLTVVPSSDAANCACCQATTRGETHIPRCERCLIGMAGYWRCLGTPWQKYNDAKTAREALTAAREEVVFIEGLLRDTE